MPDETPPPIVSQSFHQDSFLPGSDRWLRWGGLALVIGWGGCLALVSHLQVNVTIRTYGEVRSQMPPHQITAPMAGTLDQLYVVEKEAVTAGQAVATLLATEAGANDSAMALPQELTTPIAGRVLALPMPQSGQAIAQGTVIAEIMPAANDLIVQALVSPAEIGRIQEGQSVQMRVSAYPYPEYGVLSGRVLRFSPDVVACELANCPLPSGYEIDIVLSESDSQDELQPDMLLPGMVVTAEIVTQRENLLTLILQKLGLQAVIDVDGSTYG